MTEYTFVGDDMRAARTTATPTAAEFRIWFHNVDRIYAAAQFDQELSEIVRVDPDVIVLVDVAFNKHVSKDVRGALQRRWAPTFWHRHWRNGHADAPDHGLFIAVREPWARARLEDIDDPRGWARFGGVVLQGRRGHSIAVVGVYAPPFAACREVAWEESQIATLPASERCSPYELLRTDLELAVLGHEARGTPSILVGDWNTTWHPGARMNPMSPSYRRHFDGWMQWFRASEADPFDNAFYTRGHAPTPTLRRTTASNDLDFFVARRSILSQTLHRIGILHGTELGIRPVTHSEHDPVAAEFNLDAVLGHEEEVLRTPSRVLNPTAFAVLMSDETSVSLYRDRLIERWLESRISTRAAALCARSSVDDLNALYRDANACMTGASADVAATRRDRFHAYMSRQARAAVSGGDGRDSRPERRVLHSLLWLTADRDERGRRQGRGLLARQLRRLEQRHSVVLANLRVDVGRLRWLLGLLPRPPVAPSTAAPPRDPPAPADRVPAGAPDVTADADDADDADDALREVAALRQSWKETVTRLEQQHRADVKAAEAQHRADRAQGGAHALSLRRLVSTVTAREACAGSKYASLVTRDASGRLIVRNDPAAVAAALTHRFDEWMGGGGRRFWYDQTALDSRGDDGRRLRQQIVQRGSAVDMAAAGIPAKYGPVLDAFRRVPGAAEELYTTCLDSISLDDWKRYWRGRASRKAPGLTGVTNDQVKALHDAQHTDLLLILNFALRKRHVFPEWCQRAIVAVPKVPSSSDIETSRPITLVDVLQKACMGVIWGRVTRVWESHHLLDPGQLGSRKGQNAQTALAMVTALSELCCSDCCDFFCVATDISKCYDSICFGVKELALSRLGLPVDFIDYYMQIDHKNVAEVITAFGRSSEVLGNEGIFSFKRGCPQGHSESPAIWVAVLDALFSLQRRPDLGNAEGAVEITGASLRRPPTVPSPPFDTSRSTPGICFVDDGMWYSTTRRGLEIRLGVCNLFFEFIGVQFNLQKTRAMGVEWRGAPVDLITAGWTPWAYDTSVLFRDGRLNVLASSNHILADAARVGDVKVVALSVGVRYLGITWSPFDSLIDTRSTHNGMVREILADLRAVPVDAPRTEYVLDSVLWAKLAYRLRFERVSRATLRDWERAINALLLGRARVALRVNDLALHASARLGGVGLVRLEDRIYADRLDWIERILTRSDGVAGLLLEALVQQAQMKFGSREPVFESVHARDGGWAVAGDADDVRAGFIESTAIWCAARGLALRGGDVLPGAAALTDATLVDLAVAAGESRQCVARLRQFCHENDVWWKSSFLLDGHQFHTGVVPRNGVPWRSQFVALARRLLGVNRRNEVSPAHRISDTDRVAGAMRGDVVVCRYNGRLCLAEVVDMNPCWATVRLLRRRRYRVRVCVGTCVDARVDDVWHEGTVTAVADDSITVLLRSGASVDVDRRAVSSHTTSAHDLSTDPWPGREAAFVPDRDELPGVARAGLRRLAAVVRVWPEGDFHMEPVYIDLTAEQLARELHDFAAREQTAHAPAPSSPALSPSALLHGVGVGVFARVVATRFPDWQTRHDAAPLPPILVASDGSESFGEGGAGAVVLVTTEPRRLYRFCARVDAGPGVLSSYRTEVTGELLALVACHALRHVLPRAPVLAIADNRGSVSGMAQLAGSRPTPSGDVWDEIAFWRRRVVEHFGSYTLEWQRGHPERRKLPSAFTVLECCQHLADGLAALGRCGGGAADPSRGPLFSHARRWHVLVHGRRVFDGTRSSVLHALAVADWRQYEAARGSVPLTAAQEVALSAFVGASRSILCRATACKYVLYQLATRLRRRRWGYTVPDGRCVICNEASSADSLDHHLLDCVDPRVVGVRERFLLALRCALARIGDEFADLLDALVLDDSGRLRLRLSASLPDAACRRLALRLVTGRCPLTVLRRLRHAAADVDHSPRLVVSAVGRVVRARLWTPVWRLWSGSSSTSCAP